MPDNMILYNPELFEQVQLQLSKYPGLTKKEDSKSDFIQYSLGEGNGTITLRKDRIFLTSGAIQKEGLKNDLEKIAKGEILN
jgi:hypothetical protein